MKSTSQTLDLTLVGATQTEEHLGCDLHKQVGKELRNGAKHEETHHEGYRGGFLSTNFLWQRKTRLARHKQALCSRGGPAPVHQSPQLVPVLLGGPQ